MGKDWVQRLGIIEEYPDRRYSGPEVIQKLIDERSPGEKDFIESFFYRCNFMEDSHEDGSWMGPDWIPVPIPQVWIQWHSDTVEELRQSGSPFTSQPQRIDFAMFWGNQRIAILIDGIQHYASKRGSDWIASEEEYAKRLVEDRFLRSNDWEVFRISNWELRDWKKNIQRINGRANRVFHELEEFVGFEFWPEWWQEELEKSRYG
jgi:very-short-patch-repair endonuclease